MASNVVIYVGNNLGSYQPLMNSGFTTIILNSLHVNSDGSLNLNDTQLVDSSGNLTSAVTPIANAISDLKSNGGVQTVLVSVGGGGAFPSNPNGINGAHSVSDSDFKNFSSFYWSATGMTGYLSNEVSVLNSFATLLTALGADGIDLDPEPMFYTYGAFASTTLIWTKWAMQTQGALATWVPYTALPSWQATALLLSADGASLPTWINVQPPAWSSGSDLTSWATGLGVNISAIVPGFIAGDPSYIQNMLADVVNGGVDVAGAYVWNYNQIPSSDVASYATAIEQGLQGNTTTTTAAARRSA